jgi:Leucine-rich repeat (LRR) protein
LDLAYYGGSLEEIPTEIGLFTKLERFIAPESNIVGTIPTELGRCASLKLLDLSKNQLESTIPTHLGELRELQTLYLSGNAFVDDDESANNDGTPLVVPDEVCTLMETGRLLAFDLKAECPNTEQM